MRVAPILDDAGELSIDAGVRIAALMDYPEDDVSREQLLMVLSHELRRYDAAISGDYHPSDFVQYLSKRTRKGLSQRAVAGMTAIAFVWLGRQQEKRPTLYAATKLVSKANRILSKRDSAPLKVSRYKDGEMEIDSHRIVTSREDVAKIFRLFSSVAHISAAEFASANTFPAKPWPENARDHIPELVCTAAMIERRVMNRFPEYFQDPWRIAGHLPESLKHLHPLPLPSWLTRLFRESA